MRLEYNGNGTNRALLDTYEPRPTPTTRPVKRERDPLRNWANTTTLHGPSYVMHSQSLVTKLFWIIVIILGNCVMLPSIIRSILIYLHPVESWDTRIYEETRANVDIPNITVCSFNQLTYSKAKAANLTDDQIWSIAESLAYMKLHHVTISPSYFAQVGHAKFTLTEDIAAALNSTFTELYEKFAPGCEDTLLGMSSPWFPLPFKEHDNTTKICAANGEDGFKITTLLDDTIGKCFTMEFDPDRLRAQVSGSNEGILFLLDMQLDEYLPFEVNTLVTGLRVELSYRRRHRDKWVAITPGTHTYIGIQKQEVKIKEANDLPINSNPPGCLRNPELRIYDSSNYDTSMCQIECQVMALYEACGCVYGRFVMNDKYRECESIDQLCLSKIPEPSAEKVQDCKRKCLPRCDDAYVHTSVSTNAILQMKHQKEFMLDYFKHLNPKRAARLSNETIIQNMAMITIYYSTTAVMVVERYKKFTMLDILSHIGGTMGLWMGASIVTVIHGCIVLLYICKRLIFCQCTHSR